MNVQKSGHGQVNVEREHIRSCWEGEQGGCNHVGSRTPCGYSCIRTIKGSQGECARGRRAVSSHTEGMPMLLVLPQGMYAVCSVASVVSNSL